MRPCSLERYRVVSGVVMACLVWYGPVDRELHNDKIKSVNYLLRKRESAINQLFETMSM